MVWVGKTWREMTTSLLSAWFLVPTLDGHIVRAVIISRLIYIRDDNQLSPISLSQGPTSEHYPSPHCAKRPRTSAGSVLGKVCKDYQPQCNYQRGILDSWLIAVRLGATQAQ